MPRPAPTTPRARRRRGVLAGAAVLATVGVIAGGLGLGAGDDDEARRERAASLVTPTPAVPISSAFLQAACAPARMAAGSELGVGIPRAARLSAPGPERAALDGAVVCLQQVAGRPPVLRTQVPIDAARRTSPADDEISQLAAFGVLLRTYGARGILSIRSHDFTRCGRRGAPEAQEVGVLAPGAALAPCEFPTPALYAALLEELRAKTAELLPGADLLWTAWNEPDHPMFTLLDGLGSVGAARRAGEYWQVASGQLGADRVLAGEFSDRDAATLLRLKDAFLSGAGASATPTGWAIHPYRDLTAALEGPSIDEQFAQGVAGADVWLTEVTVLLSGRRGLGGNGAGQLAKGSWLRAEMARRPVRAILYLLTPPDAGRVAAGDTWDSAIADRQGRARPFICGLAGLAPEQCAGDPAPFGG